MQIRSHQLSKLKQELQKLVQSSFNDIRPFLSSRPLTRGTVYKLKRKCYKPFCRCARGTLHENMVLTASVSGKTRLWTIPVERIREFQGNTLAYRRFRQARKQFLKESLQRQRNILKIIDRIEKIRLYEP